MGGRRSKERVEGLGLGLWPEALLLESGHGWRRRRRKSHQSAARPGHTSRLSHTLCSAEIRQSRLPGVPFGSVFELPGELTAVIIRNQ